MSRKIFDAEHEAVREVYRDFLGREVVPEFGTWERNGLVPRDLFRRVGDLGLIGLSIPSEFGGGGTTDYRYNAVLNEENARAAVTLGALRTHMDVVLPYFLELCDREQQQRWFPGFVTGDLISSIAMTEPDAGSDLAGIRTSAIRRNDEYVVNGAKTFISGGWHADLVVVVVRTGEAGPKRRAGLSLLVVEAGMPGFTKERLIEKIGLGAQDTAELAFSNVRVPVANLLGEEGRGFEYLERNLAQERLAIAVGAQAVAESAIRLAVEYVKHRRAFGRTIGEFQNTKFELADVTTRAAAGRALINEALLSHVDGLLTGADAAVAKLYCTEMQGSVVDRCVQLFGGYGYCREFPISRLYTDARSTRIFGGTSEIMKSIISKSLAL